MESMDIKSEKEWEGRGKKKDRKVVRWRRKQRWRDREVEKSRWS